MIGLPSLAALDPAALLDAFGLDSDCEGQPQLEEGNFEGGPNVDERARRACPIGTFYATAVGIPIYSATSYAYGCDNSNNACSADDWMDPDLMSYLYGLCYLGVGDGCGGGGGGGGGGDNCTSSAFQCVQDAINDAQQRLTQPKCAQALGNDNLASTVLSDMQSKGNIRAVPDLSAIDPNVDPDAAALTEPPPTGDAALSDAFIAIGGGENSSFMTGKNALHLSGDAWRTPVVLHALGHATGKFGPDVNAAGLNAAHTNSVISNCF